VFDFFSCHKETIQMRVPGEMTGTRFMVIPPPEWMKMAARRWERQKIRCDVGPRSIH
jgi:hypothetical protein